MTTKKEPRDYQLLDHYDVMTVENESIFIYSVKEGISTVQYFITDSELFHIFHKVFLTVGCRGDDRMLKKPSTKYRNLTHDDIELFIHFCELCPKKQEGIKVGIVVKPRFFLNLIPFVRQI